MVKLKERFSLRAANPDDADERLALERAQREAEAEQTHRTRQALLGSAVARQVVAIKDFEQYAGSPVTTSDKYHIPGSEEATTAEQKQAA